MPVGSVGSHREVLDVNDLIALERPHRPLVQLAPVPAQERSMAVAPPPPWVPQPPPANLPSQAAAPQAAPQSANAASDLASMPGLLNLTGSGGGGAAALFADTPSGGGAAAPAAPAATVTTAVLQPGNGLLLLGTLPPDAEAVGPFAAPLDPTPAAPPPTASTEQIALVELLLGDPLMVEVIAAYGPTAPTALPPNATTDALVAQYGHDLTCRMLQASGAITGLLNEYLRAMDRAAQHGPDAGGPGCVFTPGTPVQGEQDGRAAKWHFDPTLFTADYARGDSLAARAFASLHGQDGGFATITRTLNATTESGEIHTTTSGGIDLDSARFTLQDVGDAGSALHWEGARIGSHALAQVDLDAPPEMFDPTAVWFDPALGLVTSNANLVPEDSLAETVVITVVIGVVTWGIGSAICGAAQLAVTSVGGGAIMGATSAVIGGLFQNGTVSFEDVVRGAVTGAITAAVAQNLDSWGVDPQTKAITDWGARAGAATGKATVQGILAELTGGKFKDAFGPAFASSLAADVGRNIDAAIAKAARGGDLNPEQVSAYRTLGRAVTTAIGALGDPDDPLAGFAQDFLGDMLKEEITLRAAAGAGTGTGTRTDVGAGAGPRPDAAEVGAEDAPVEPDFSGVIETASGGAPGNAGSTAGTPSESGHATATDRPGDAVEEPVQQVVVIGSRTPGAAATSATTGGSDSIYSDRYLSVAGAPGVYPVGGHENLVPAPDLAPLPAELTPRLLDGTPGRGLPHRDQAGQVFYETFDADNNFVGWTSAPVAVAAPSAIAQLAPAAEAVFALERAIRSPQLLLAGAIGATAGTALWTLNSADRPVWRQALTPEELSGLQAPMVNVPESPGPAGTPGYVADVRDTSTPGYGVIEVPPAPSTTTPIVEQSWADLIIHSRIPDGDHFVGPMRPSNWEAPTANPDAHALTVHGGAVTDSQLITRAITGLKPDGSTGPIPQLSSAFYSDDLLIETDLRIRNGGALQNAIARQPGRAFVRVEVQDVGDLGISLGYGYNRVGATANESFNANAIGPLQRIDNLTSAQGVYKFNSTTGVWETVTIYPAPW
jgi:hypothetical protein